MNLARVFFGALLAVAGVLWLLDAAGALDAGEVVGTWWPLVIVGAGILSLVSNPRHWAAPAIVIIVGIALLLRTTDVVDSFAVVGPALLIGVGVAVIFGVGFGSRQVTTGDRINSFNVFSGAELASHSRSFEGGNVGALFGGAEINLRDAVPADGASIDLFAMFGGVELKVPEGWNVVIRGFPIFGGFDNVTAKEQVGPEAPVLTVNATVLFGGLEVKH
jgi:hypothetical protein